MGNFALAAFASVMAANRTCRLMNLVEIRFNKPSDKGQQQTGKLKPIGERILVQTIEEKESVGRKGVIIIPDTAKEKPMESLVVALGTGKTDDKGKKVPFEVKKGDRVLVAKYGGTDIKLDGKETEFSPPKTSSRPSNDRSPSRKQR